MAQQSLRCILHQIQHMLEAVGAPEIRIWHFAFVMVFREIKEQPKMALGRVRTQFLKYGKIGCIHRQHVVEPTEIRCFHLASAQCTHVVTALLGGMLCARVRCLADVVVVRACRVDADELVQPGLPGMMTEYGLGRG